MYHGKFCFINGKCLLTVLETSRPRTKQIVNSFLYDKRSEERIMKLIGIGRIVTGKHYEIDSDQYKKLKEMAG